MKVREPVIAEEGKVRQPESGAVNDNRKNVSLTKENSKESRMQKDYRHEWKHEINYADMLAIRQRMRAVARPDPHAADGCYLIRSLYFDTANDKALREKTDGVNRREKWRIRYYNLDPSGVIRLEKKSRVNGLGTKYGASLSREEAQKIVDGETGWMAEETGNRSGEETNLLRELYAKMRYQGMRPKTIVEYKREPFIYDPGNVRVTLDYDIRTGLRNTDFLDPQCVTIPAGEAPIILEVKWDAFLPSVIRDAVQLPNRRAAAFSKYAQCRVYG